MPARKPTQKPSLASEFRRRMREANMTARQVADRIGVVDVTLRTWLARNRFSKKAAEDLAGALLWEISADRMRAKFHIDKNTWARGGGRASDDSLTCADLFGQFDRKARSVGRRLERTDHLSALLGAMGTNDLAVFATATVTPPEMTANPPARLLDDISRAVTNGGRLLYLRPDDAYLGRFRDRYDTALPYDDEIDQELARLRAEVRRRLVGDATRANTHIVQIRGSEDAAEFFVPGLRFGMIHSLPEPGTTRIVRMLVWLPAGHGGALYLPSEQADYFANRFTKFALTGLRAAERPPDPAGGAARAALHNMQLLLEVKRCGP